ncbi:MAG: hypothetical protein KAR39_12400 [Thermoplasmata archaeon]|nr:hypothetical protein [Thermoplasmata archaeon]
MAEIKDTQATASKWARRTASATQEYTEGVANPKKDWASETAKAESNYVAGIQKSIANKSFGKGVKRTGTAGWQEAALTKGPARFAAGVQDAEQRYAAGYDPYRQVIANLTLPPRGPKGDPINITRVAMIADALHKAKLART